MLERATELPALDAASTDINKSEYPAIPFLKRRHRLLAYSMRSYGNKALIACSLYPVVRSSYADEFYTQLAREAIEAWKDREVWGDNYHE